MNPQYTALANQVASLLESQKKEALKPICELLKESVPHYDWVGFYFMDNQRQLLKLGPYAGEETDHVEIPFGKGICGQVALSGQTFLVKDVTEEDNYIACSIKTKSEIVVPIYKGELLVGQIDIDSHKHNAFSTHDQDFLKQICDWLSEVL